MPVTVPVLVFKDSSSSGRVRVSDSGGRAGVADVVTAPAGVVEAMPGEVADDVVAVGVPVVVLEA
jgi:hypothetical protein